MATLYWILGLISKGDRAAAIQELSKILKADPQNIEAWSLLALAVNEPARKADCYRQILRIDPENQHARSNLEALEAASKGQAPPVQPAAPETKPQTQLCTYCGALFVAGATRCDKCGRKVETQLASSDITADQGPTSPPTQAAGLEDRPFEPVPLPVASSAEPALEPSEDQPAPPLAASPSADLLQQAAQAHQQGDTPHARQLLKEAIKADVHNDDAWQLWVATSPNPEIMTKAISNWVKYNPSPRALQAQAEHQPGASLQHISRPVAQPAQSAARSSQPRPEGCLQQALYLIIGAVIFFVTAAIITTPGQMILGNDFGDLSATANNPIALPINCCSSLLLLLAWAGWFSLEWLAWEPRWLKNETIRGIILLVAVLTPVGWYWMGKGALLLYASVQEKRSGS